MTRWLVELQGERFDTEEFVFWFPDGDEVFGVSEGSAHYLTGPAFQVCPAAERVDELANQYIDELLSVIVLLQAGVKRPTVGHIIRENDDGSRDRFALMQGHAGGRAKLRAQLETTDPILSPTQAQEFLRTARTCRHLQVALSLLALPACTWPHLYRCLEELELFLGKTVHAAGLCSNNEYKRFKRTANSGEAAGLNARHGFGNFAGPPTPMPLVEARGFVTGLATAVLKKTLAQVKQVARR